MRYTYSITDGVFVPCTGVSDIYKSSVVYDDVVDRSHFTLDSESVRDSIMSNAVGASSSVLKYDTDSSTMPTDFEVQLRQGKLDKADVYQHQLQLQKDIESGLKSKSDAKKESSKVSEIVSDSSEQVKPIE